MKMIKALLLAAILLLPVSAFAMDGDQQVEYTQALRDGNVKMVKKYLDSGTDVNEKFFAWSALQIAANQNQLAVVKFLVNMFGSTFRLLMALGPSGPEEKGGKN